MFRMALFKATFPVVLFLDAESGQNPGEIFRNGRFKLDCFLRPRMGERQLPGMQHDAWRGLARNFRQPQGLPAAIGWIAEDGKTQVLKMDADLMRASRVEQGLDERGPAQTFDHAVAGPGFSSGALRDRHLFSMAGMSRDRRSNLPRQPRHLATGNREVSFLDRASGKLLGQEMMRDRKSVV